MQNCSQRLHAPKLQHFLASPALHYFRPLVLLPCGAPPQPCSCSLCCLWMAEVPTRLGNSVVVDRPAWEALNSFFATCLDGLLHPTQYVAQCLGLGLRAASVRSQWCREHVDCGSEHSADPPAAEVAGHLWQCPPSPFLTPQWAHIARPIETYLFNG